MLCKNIPEDFDSTNLDKKIGTFVDIAFEKTFVEEINKNHIAVLASQFYDIGGHTEVVKRLVSNLSDTYEIKTFLTQKIHSYRSAPLKMNLIGQHSKIDGLNCYDHDYKDSLNIMFDMVKNFAPRVIFVFIHPDDAFGTALMALIKKYTNIKLIFFNHASHYPALGFSFADLILAALPSAHYIDKTYRKINKHYILEMFSDKVENIKYFSDSEIEAVRQELGITKDNYCTMSGAACYKFFEDDKSPYFEMIKRLLIKEEKLKHIVISDILEEKREIIESIFQEPQLRERLILLRSTGDYPILFQSCDVFIDSFPVSSALTQIDLMKFKKPTVVKVNNENILWSFHEYMPKNYPYMFDNVEDMENGILELLYDKAEQQMAVEMNYNHYLKTFEGNVVKQKYINLIENSDNLEQFYKK